MNEKDIHTLVLLQRRFAKLYRKGNLVSIRDEYVHLSDETMVELMKTADSEITVTDRHEDEYPLEFAMTFEGVKFLAIMTFAEVKQYDLKVFVPEKLLVAYTKCLFDCASHEKS